MIAFRVGIRDAGGLIIAADHSGHFRKSVQIGIGEKAKRNGEMSAVGPFRFGKASIDKSVREATDVVGFGAGHNIFL